MYIIHSPSEVMQLHAHLSTLLPLPLQPTKDMIERQHALPRGPDAPTAHTTHTPEALRLDRRTPSDVGTSALREREGGVAV